MLLGKSSLLLGLLLLQFSVCYADDATSATVTVPEIYQANEIGEPDDGLMKEKPRVVDLGEQKYRIGTINIDKGKRLFTVPGVMLPYENNKPIEFMASTENGFKSYESVLTLNTNAFEFNLACILIGLEVSNAVAPRFHSDPNPIQGDPVSIKVKWNQNGQEIELNIVELLKVDGKKPGKPSSWSYTGSTFIQDRYLAQMDGVLIGLIHDPASIIEHKEGFAIGNWGGVTIDSDIAPSSGKKISIEIQSLKKL